MKIFDDSCKTVLLVLGLCLLASFIVVTDWKFFVVFILSYLIIKVLTSLIFDRSKDKKNG